MSIKEVPYNIEQPVSNHTNFHGATVIDDYGRETPITETMVRNACNKLIEDWEHYGTRTRSLKAS